MRRQEALDKFVKENLRQLTSPAMTSDALKKLRQQFFSRHHLRSGDGFRTDDVTNAVLQVLVKKKFESPADFVREALQLPFVRDEMAPEELLEFYGLQKPSDSLLSADDLSRIEQQEHLRRVEATFEERAMSIARATVEAQTEELQRMQDELSKGLAEIETFKSELDDVPPKISIADLVAQTVEPERQEASAASRSWWKEIGLEGDPFPSNQGLNGIPPEKYQDIIVETPFFDFYIDALKSDPNKVLNKTTLVVGEFGSGKTTLFHYMMANVGNSRVLPISVTLNPHPSVSSLTSRMMEQVHSALSESYAARFQVDPRREGGANDEFIENLNLMRELARDGVTIGFLVFVDGLHKGDAYADAVFEFLQQIQNVQEFFVSREVPVGFIIAGSPAWEAQLERRPSLSGSFYRKDTIPPLSEQSAISAVTRRLSSYTAERLTPPRVRGEDLRRAFNILSSRLGRPLTFRDYLDHIRGRFEARDYQDLGLVVRLHPETVNAVQTALRRSPLGSHYARLVAEVQGEPVLRYSCKRSLTSILLKDGIGERHAIFQDNKPAFFILKKHGLIAQRTNAEDKFRWMLTRELNEAIVQVAKDLHLGPDHVITAAFEHAQAVRAEEAARIYSVPISIITEAAVGWRDAWPEVVPLLARVGDILGKVDALVAEGRHEDLSPSDLQQSVEALVDVLNTVNGSPHQREDSSRWTRFAAAWYVPENLEVIRRLGRQAALPANESALYGVLHEHSAVVSQLLRLTQECVRGEAISRLQGRSLSVEEAAAVHEMRMNFLKQGYRSAIDQATSLLEERIRETVFPAMRAVWGARAFERLPTDIQRSLEGARTRGHPRAKRAADFNFLYDVSRSEYSKIIFESHINKAVFGDLLDSRGREQARDIIALAFSLNDGTAHRVKSQYFREHATEIGDVLKALPRLLELFHSVCQRFLAGDVRIERQSDGSVKARFIPDALNSPPSTEHTIAKRDVSSVTRATLEELAFREKTVLDLGKSISIGSLPSEVAITVLCAAHKFGAINVSRPDGSPVVISLTDTGRRELERAHGVAQRTLGESIPDADQ